MSKEYVQLSELEYWKKAFGGTRPLPIPGRTYVPWELLEGWDDWDIEQPMYRVLTQTIEDSIKKYEELINRIVPANLTWLDRLTIRFGKSRNLDVRCRHGVYIYLEKCASCDTRNRQNIAFLHELKSKALDFYCTQAFWLGLDGISFEKQVSQLFKQLGKTVELTKASGDWGVDVFLRDASGLTAVQCKAHKGKIGPSVIRDLYGAMAHFQADRGMVISTGGYTVGARDFALNKAIDLLDLSDLLKLQLQTHRACEEVVKKSVGDNARGTSVIPARCQRFPGEECEFEIDRGVMMWMCWIPPGEFLMGSPASELGRIDNETQHRVTITQGFWLGKYEVTQEQWQAVMGSNPSHFRGINLPVESVSWDMISRAGGFLEKANRFVAAGGRFSLPTEAQWEYACRAGTTTGLNNGTNLTSTEGACRNLDEVAWYRQNSGGKTHLGGLKRPNAWGLHDMHGNLWEWCADWLGDYPTGPVADPPGALRSRSGARVIRGGSWGYWASTCHVACRGGHDPTDANIHDGFRVARSSVPSK